MTSVLDDLGSRSRMICEVKARGHVTEESDCLGSSGNGVKIGVTLRTEGTVCNKILQILTHPSCNCYKDGWGFWEVTIGTTGTHVIKQWNS